MSGKCAGRKWAAESGRDRPKMCGGQKNVAKILKFVEIVLLSDHLLFSKQPFSVAIDVKYEVTISDQLLY